MNNLSLDKLNNIPFVNLVFLISELVFFNYDAILL